jgi:hypothetical protein
VGGDVVPRKSLFSRRPSEHALALADWNIHTFLAARASGSAVIEEFAPENEERYETGGGLVIPDTTYRFGLPSGQRYTFFLELDNSTETQIYRRLKANTIEEKVRRYERLHYELASPDQLSPFRVVFACVRSRQRAENILATVRKVVRQPRRSIFYAVFLNDYLRSSDPLHAPIFRDQQGRAVALLPPPMSLPVADAVGVGEWQQAEHPHARHSEQMAAMGDRR